MEITDRNSLRPYVKLTLTAPIFFMKITTVQHHYAETLVTEFHPIYQDVWMLQGFN